MSSTADASEITDRKKSKRDKVRSAWISFAGRIVAQIVGAGATVALGVMVLHRYSATDARLPAPDLKYEAPVHVIVLTPAMLGLRDSGARTAHADLNCTSAVNTPPTSAAHLNGSGGFGVR